MTRERAVLCALVLAACVGAWAGVSICPFAALTGIPCPGCGLGRATLALITGHPDDAFRLHPLVFVVLPTVAMIAVMRTNVGGAIARRWARPIPRLAFTLAAASVLVALVGVWIARFEGALGGPVPVKSMLRRSS